MLVEVKALFVADSAGERRGIRKIDLETGVETMIVKDEFGRYAVQSMSIDWLNCWLLVTAWL